MTEAYDALSVDMELFDEPPVSEGSVGALPVD
jgi:hypothetical protein